MIDAVALCTGSLLLYAAFTSRTFITGDPVVYLDQIRRMDLGQRSGHFGYYLAGILFTRLVPAVDDTLALSLMSSLVAGVGVALVYLVARQLACSRFAAVVAALAVGLRRVWMFHAVFAHYIMLQTVLTWAAIYAWLRHRSLGAGLCFGAATLVTPLTALSAPLFVIRRFGIRDAAALVAGTALVYVPFVAVHYQDLFWGPRGVFNSGILDPSARLTLALSAARVGYHAALKFGGALVLAAIGIGALARRTDGWRLVAALLISFSVLAAFGVSHCSNWFFLPMYPLVAVTIGAGADWLRQHAIPAVTAAAVGIMLLSQCVGSIWALSGQRSEQLAFRDLSQAVQARRAPESDREEMRADSR